MDDKMFERLVVASERTAQAQEDLITLATEEREVEGAQFGPPVCPHCLTFNPEVRSEGGDGPMSEFALVSKCGNCDETIYAVPQGWLCFKTPEDARNEIEGRNQ